MIVELGKKGFAGRNGAGVGDLLKLMHGRIST